MDLRVKENLRCRQEIYTFQFIYDEDFFNNCSFKLKYLSVPRDFDVQNSELNLLFSCYVLFPIFIYAIIFSLTSSCITQKCYLKLPMYSWHICSRHSALSFRSQLFMSSAPVLIWANVCPLFVALKGTSEMSKLEEVFNSCLEIR